MLLLALAVVSLLVALGIFLSPSVRLLYALHSSAARLLVRPVHRAMSNNRRLYVGGVDNEADLDKLFRPFGKIASGSLQLKQGFCFFEFEDSRDAEVSHFVLPQHRLNRYSLFRMPFGS